MGMDEEAEQVLILTLRMEEVSQAYFDVGLEQFPAERNFPEGTFNVVS